MAVYTKESKEESKAKKLEESLLEKITPVIDNVMSKFMGATISELNKDISEKLKKSDMMGLPVYTHLNFRQARKMFRREYLQRLLIQNRGNITKVAEISQVDRRSIHRIVSDSGVDVYTIRKEMLKPTYLQMRAVSMAVEASLDDFKDLLNPNKIDYIYQNLHEVSEEILDELPSRPLTLKEAEKDFEAEYFRELLKECRGKIVCVAKKSGLRYETAHRKLKELKLESKEYK